ncbi:uncharacterized protein BDV17DRAFT_296699 [Aspergillus undulatus]|uniref:uncharacterized protein n=1 Tax=Aspergillus undulatus TaxID=1810928 RepID=UPI003CCD79C7
MALHACFSRLGVISIIGTWLTLATAQCLSSTQTGLSNYAACCSAAPTGRESVDGVEFLYECGRTAVGKTPPSTAETAGLCASACTKSPTCKAAGWDAADGRCFLSEDATRYTAQGLLFIEAVQKVSTPDCQAAIEQAIDRETQKCDTKIVGIEQRLGDQCSAEKNDLKTACDGKLAGLENEKDTAVQKYNSLLGDYSSCQDVKVRLEEKVDTLTRQLASCRAGDGGQENNSAKRSGCPTPDGKLVTVGSSTYAITCGRSYFSAYAKMKLVPKAPNFEACVSLCSAETACRGITYDERPEQQWCTLHYEIGAEEVSPSVVARRVD